MRDPALAAFQDLFGPEFGHGKPYALDRLKEALRAMGNPQLRLPPTIHVAGTNGKGSTIAFMRAIAEAAGLRVHAFTKPHLLRLNERFVLAGEAASDETLRSAAQKVARAAPELTQFEAQAAAAFLLFADTPADLCLIEAGMGGREDATNALEQPRACVLTPIGIDHQDVLGPTLAEIAAHKAGILKPGAPAIVARQSDEARAVIEAYATRIGAPLLSQGAEWDAFVQQGRLVVQIGNRVLDLAMPSLHGPHQIDNAGLAVAALLTADIAPISDTQISRGLAAAQWPGRLQPLTRGRLHAAAAGAELWIDGGHNEHAARALGRALEAMQRRRMVKTALVIGMRARKDWRAFVEAMAPCASLVAAVPVADAGVEPTLLAAHARTLGVEASVAASLEEAIAGAAARGAGRILVCGSLVLAASALREA